MRFSTQAPTNVVNGDEVIGDFQDHFVTALEAVDQLLLKRKELMLDRVAAFVKRILLVCVQLQPHNMLAGMSLVRSIFHRYSKLHQLLDNDQDRVSSGSYRADVDDPDWSNPFACAVWELAELRFHYHPMVSSFAKGTAKLEPSMVNQTPQYMAREFNG